MTLRKASQKAFSVPTSYCFWMFFYIMSLLFHARVFYLVALSTPTAPSSRSLDLPKKYDQLFGQLFFSNKWRWVKTKSSWDCSIFPPFFPFTETGFFVWTHRRSWRAPRTSCGARPALRLGRGRSVRSGQMNEFLEGKKIQMLRRLVFVPLES